MVVIEREDDGQRDEREESERAVEEECEMSKGRVSQGATRQHQLSQTSKRS